MDADMLRVHNLLAPELEGLITQTIGHCIAIHRALGPGLPEHAYARALALELAAAHVSFERERRFPIEYRGEYLCDLYVDFVVAGVLIVEIKSVEQLAPIHHAQTLNYLRVSQIRAGLLVNFNVAVLKEGIRRKVL